MLSVVQDGLGDTIRVSLTEPPEEEIDPCRRLATLGMKAAELQQGVVGPFLLVVVVFGQSFACLISLSEFEYYELTIHSLSVRCHMRKSTDTILIFSVDLASCPFKRRSAFYDHSTLSCYFLDLD